MGIAIYLISVLSNIKTISWFFICILSIVPVGAFLVTAIVGENIKVFDEISKRIFKWFLIFCIFFTILSIFIPEEKSMYAILAVHYGADPVLLGKVTKLAEEKIDENIKKNG